MTRRLIFVGLALALASSAAGQDHPITEIRLERTPCFGTCPVDEVVLRTDGTATYIGKRFVERMGRYEGLFSEGEFERLAELLESQGYFAMQDRYDEPITDMPTVITRATRGGRTKVVENYADAGPVALWGIERAIRGIAAEIEWEQVGE